jgi:hypothetical protein
MNPSGYYGAVCIGDKTGDLRFCAGGANNLYQSAMLYESIQQPIILSKLTMRDPRCEHATFTGHVDVYSIVNVDNTLICKQKNMITIYDERADAMIGTPFTADGYIGACRTR